MRRAIFLLVFLTIVGAIFFYLGHSLGSPFGWVILSFLFPLVFSFPFIRHRPSIIQITFLAMGFLSYLIVFVLLKDLLHLAGILLPVIWVYGLALLAVLVGTFIAHRGPTIVRLKLPFPDLPEDLEGLRIVQISDLHVGPTIGKKYVEKIVQTTNGLNPDVIALTGDIGDGPVSMYRDDIAPFANLRSKYGVFYVPGNHEYYWNANEWMNVLNNLNVIILLNRGKKIQINQSQILMGGVSDPVGHPKPDPVSVIQAGMDSPLKVLLSHRPGLATEAAKLGFHLQLSGHTHGGQFFPWTVLVRFVHKHFLGHHMVNGMWLNVNSGTGSWGPFLRLGTTSEITLIEIFRSNKSLE